MRYRRELRQLHNNQLPYIQDNLDFYKFFLKENFMLSTQDIFNYLDNNDNSNNNNNTRMKNICDTLKSNSSNRVINTFLKKINYSSDEDSEDEESM